MNDFDALREWVQPQHLATSGVDSHRADFESHLLHVLHITDFLKADKVARLARFLDQEATYEQIYVLYATDGKYGRDQVSADVWRTADKDSRWYICKKMTGHDPRFRLSLNLLSCLDFCNMVITRAFRAYLSAVMGLPLVGDFLYRGFHQMWPGDILGPHNDDTQGHRSTASSCLM